MKRYVALLLLMVAFSLTGCNFEVEHDTFNIPVDMVQTVELQKEFKNPEGESYYLSKTIGERGDIEDICDLISTLPVERANSNLPNPIRSMSLIIIFKGQKEHRLIVNEELVFYDQVAYKYSESDTYGLLMNIYDNMQYDETETEAKPF